MSRRLVRGRRTRLSAGRPSIGSKRLPMISTNAFFESWENHKFADRYSRTSAIAKDLGLTRQELLARLRKRRYRIGKFCFFPAASRFDKDAYLEIWEYRK